MNTAYRLVFSEVDDFHRPRDFPLDSAGDALKLGFSNDPVNFRGFQTQSANDGRRRRIAVETTISASWSSQAANFPPKALHSNTHV